MVEQVPQSFVSLACGGTNVCIYFIYPKSFVSSVSLTYASLQLSLCHFLGTLDNVFSSSSVRGMFPRLSAPVFEHNATNVSVGGIDTFQGVQCSLFVIVQGFFTS